MQVKRIAVMMAAAMTGGCTMSTMSTMTPVGTPVAIERETIRYATEPCFGTCPVYSVTVQPDGSGVFTGVQHTAVTGERAFKATPDAYRRFAARLQPYRPAQGDMLYEQGTALCPNAATDGPSVDVRWSDISGGGAHLRYYYGCGVEKLRPMADALRAAPADLPIAAFIGPR
ncbi:hypothetical protein ASE75_10815 [Sphingomonas sp. Leaf17]|nr:hypothetical protein ASE75_10815 [Sphingomonas sp. Leaf17]